MIRRTMIRGILAVVLLLSSGCHTAPEIDQVIIGVQVNDRNEVVEPTDVFTVDTDAFFLQADVAAPPDTEVTAVWRYQDDDVLIDQSTLYTQRQRESLLFVMANDGNPWPPGHYEVRLFVSKIEQCRIPFQVDNDGRPYTRHVALVEDVDPVTGHPQNLCDGYRADAPAFHLAAVIHDAIPDQTRITAVWTRPDGQEAGSQSMVPDLIQQTLTFTLTQPDTVWDAGQYTVSLWINGVHERDVQFQVNMP